MPFIIILIEESKIEQLVSCEVEERMASMPLEKNFNSLNYIEEDVV